MVRPASGSLLLYAALAVLAAGAPGCASPAGGAAERPASEAPPSRAPRLFIVGLDGFSWDIALPLVREGKMPVFNRLLEESSWGVLESIEPMLSPALWTSVATGFPREDHGIGFFTVKARGRYEMQTVDSTMRRRPAFWEIINRHGGQVGLVSWPVTYPAEPVDGFCVSSEFREETASGAHILHPPGLEDEIRAALSGTRRLTGAFAPLVLHDPQLRSTCEKDFKAHLVSLRLTARLGPDVVATYLAGADVVSHLFWELHDPAYRAWKDDGAGARPASEGEAPPDFVSEYYRFIDHLIGEMTAGLPPETYLLVLSDHGARGVQGDEFVGLDVNRLLVRLGFQSAEEGKIRWEATSAFNLGDYLDAERAIYINLAGREEKGLVSPEHEDAFAVRLAEALADVSDSEGRPLFESVRINRADEESSPGVSDHQPPDLIVAVRDAARDSAAIVVNGVAHSPRELFVEHYPHLGTHATEGVFLCRGPGIRRAFEMDARRLLDAFPTILHLSGLPVPEDAPGRPVLEMFEKDHLARDPVRTVATYGRRVAAAGAPLSPLETEALNRLRALGYID